MANARASGSHGGWAPVGLDLWEAGFAKLKREPLDDGLVFKADAWQ